MPKSPCTHWNESLIGVTACLCFIILFLGFAQLTGRSHNPGYVTLIIGKTPEVFKMNPVFVYGKIGIFLFCFI